MALKHLEFTQDKGNINPDYTVFHSEMSKDGVWQHIALVKGWGGGFPVGGISTEDDLATAPNAMCP